MKDGAVAGTKPYLTFKQRISSFKIELSILMVFIAIFLVYLIGNTRVFTSYDIYNAFMSTMPFVGVLALALTFVVTLGEIDLSFPSVIAVSAWVLSTVLLLTGSVIVAVLACIAVGIIAGLLNSLLIVGFGIPSIVATIGTQFFFRGLVNVLAAGNGISLISAKTAADSWVYQMFVGRIGGVVPAQFVWFVALAVVLWFIFYRHRFGTHVSFTGDNINSSIMMGINVKRIKLTVYVMMGVFASFSGILSNFEVTYFYPSQGDGLMMPALAAVFIGGTSVFGGRGTIVGSFIGALIMGSLEAGIVAIGINGFWIKFIYGLIIMISVSIYSFILKKTK